MNPGSQKWQKQKQQIQAYEALQMSMIGLLPNIQDFNCSRGPNPSVGKAIPCVYRHYGNTLDHLKVGPLTQILLMEEILHQLIGSLSHDLQGFIHPRWCRISSINRMFNV